MTDLDEPRQVMELSRWTSSEDRRAKMLEFVTDGGTWAGALEFWPVSETTLEKWRQRYPAWWVQVQTALSASRSDAAATRKLGDRPSFVEFRRKWFGMETPWFQAELVQRLKTAPKGAFILVLLHPEAGKTSTIEQWIAEELVHDPTLRFLFATSDKPKSQKRIQQIQRMLSDDGPYPEFVAEFGPFKPEQGAGGYQPWTKQFFNVVGKQDSEERDYSVSAAGIEENIQGARCDWLVFDDIQDMKSLNRTAKMMSRIRQEWLTRPGPLGRVLAIGTRVGPGDIWEELEESGLVTEVIKYPAVVEGYEDWPIPTSKKPECLPPPSCRFLFPERYTPQDYLHMRFTAGEVAWDRNYMQRGTDAASQPFTKEIVMAHADPIRSVNTPAELFCRMNPDARHLVLSLDPGFGVNAVMLSCLLPTGMVVLDGRLDEGLTSNASIAAVCREMLAKWCIEPLQCTHFVIEDKAFQRGLLKDDSFRDIAVDYGCQIVPYTTGSEKNDPDIGVPSLTAAFEQGRIVFPAADDDATNRFMADVVKQFSRWRPNVSGARLKQDYVMVCWFTFLRWRKMRATLDQLGANPDRSNTTSPFKVAGLPYAPTQIVMPSGFNARW